MTMRNPAFGDDSDADFGRNPIQRGDLPRCRLSGCCSQSSRHGAVGASGLRLMMAEGEMQSLERAAGFFLVLNTRKT